MCMWMFLCEVATETKHLWIFSSTHAAIAWSVGILVGDSVQQSYVSSSESAAQNILANGIIGPLILEVCEF